jgi:uncharacterized glyoxalase superfamily protein PhnB
VHADLDTVIIFSSDAERLAAFYAAALGLGDPERSPGHLGFHAGRTYLGIDQVDTDHDGASSVALWFRVDDVDAAFARLVAEDAEVIYAPVDKPWGDRLASLRDPDGNRIGLSQRS